MKSSGNSTVKSIIIMTTKLIKNCFGGVPYESPSTNPIAMKNEGVLCASGEFTIQKFEHDDETLNF